MGYRLVFTSLVNDLLLLNTCHQRRHCHPL